MIAFICATPVQVFNALTIMHNKFRNKKMDIYALNFRVDMRQILKYAEKTPYINNIYYIDYIIKANNLIQIFKDYVIQDKEFREIFDNNNKYDLLFTTWVGGYGSIIFNKLLKNNPKLKIAFYEEGIGIYMQVPFGYYGGIRKFFKIMGQKCEADYVKDMYLYRPDMIYEKTPLNPVAIGKVDKSDKQFIDMINTSLGIDNNIEDSKKMIYLENYFEPSLFGEFDQIPIIRAMGNDVVARLHPITDRKKYEDQGVKVEKSKLSWEFCLLNMENINERTFVSIYSSALFSPKIIFDLEPRIIVLGKAVRNFLKGKNEYYENYYPKSFATMVESIKKSYRTPEKVIIPNTMDDFYQLIGGGIC